MKLSIKMIKERETKGTFRFKEMTDDPYIGTLYIKKRAFKDSSVPDMITVTIESE